VNSPKETRGILVGAVASDLVLDCDIDTEIYCPKSSTYSRYFP